MQFHAGVAKGLTQKDRWSPRSNRREPDARILFLEVTKVLNPNRYRQRTNPKAYRSPRSNRSDNDKEEINEGKGKRKVGEEETNGLKN